LAKDINFAEDKVSFQAPDDFTPLTQKEIDLKFPSKQAPRYVLGDKDRVSTIAYDFKKVKLPSTNREEMQKELTKVFDRSVAGIKWIKNEITSINNFQWVYFEITSSAIDTDIHNIILMAPYAEGMVAFNFNATKKSFPKHEAQFRKALASIKLKL
jgi:hypothetical protein